MLQSKGVLLQRIIKIMEGIGLLTLTAAGIGILHTLTGPDHYVPFIMMARAGHWSYRKTIWITLLCGAGHVGSSVAIGFIGIVAGLAITSIELVEGFRANLAVWAIILFGLIYTIWGLRRAYQNISHSHFHEHDDGVVHFHSHNHRSEHMHVHQTKESKITPWVIFVIFVLGPCEPLIPLLMYPAAQHNMGGVVLVSGVFAAATILTMLFSVLLGLKGIRLIRLNLFDRYMHAIAGFSILLCGLAMEFLGL